MSSALRARAPAVLSVLAVLGTMVAQSFGRIVPDTKVQLALAPGRYVEEALQLWHPSGAFGHIPNQAAGYLFPMGPYFAGAAAVGVPGWFAQRLWWALLVVVAGAGCLRVMTALGVGTAGTRAVAAASFALSPPMLTSLATTSGGLLPMALAPWALLPLIRGAAGETTARRAAARSALVVAAMGGVNAISTLGALPLSAMYLMTRQRGTARRSLMAWWIPCVALATLWWTGPLLIQARFGFDFVPFTESAATTSATSSAVEVLRGGGYWLAHLHSGGDPWLPAGWTIVAHPGVVLATGCLAAGGLAGLCRRDLVERRFLVLSAGSLLAAITIAYAGTVGSPLAGAARELLDGPLSPLRNLHKLQPGLRLVLAVGLGHLLAVVGTRAGRATLPSPRAVALAVAATLVAAGALPLAQGALAPAGGFREVPGYWRETAAWLDENAGPHRSLIVPAAAFAEYTWGRPLEEPLQSLARSRWAVRDLIPLGSVGSTRLLDAVDAAIATGQGVPGLAATLRRAGVAYLVVRNDLDRDRTGAPAPGVVRSALHRSPGLELAHRVGPRVTKVLDGEQLVPDLTVAADDLRAVEIWKVRPQPPAVSVAHADQAIALAGDPGSSLALAGTGVIGSEPLVIAPADVAETGRNVVTDDVRRRARQFGDVRGGISHSLAGDEAEPLDRRPAGLGPDDADTGPRARVVLEGARSIRASSAGRGNGLAPDVAPRAAFDGDAATAWISAGSKAAGQWIEIELDRTTDVPHIDIQLLRDRPTRAVAVEVGIQTDTGRTVHRLRPTAASQRVTLRGGGVRRVRIELTRVRNLGEGFGGAGIAEVTIPEVAVRSRVVLPRPTGEGPVTTVLSRQRSAVFRAGLGDEETAVHRRFHATGQVMMEGSVSLAPGADLTPYLPPSGLRASATSRWEGLATFAPDRAFDGRASTAWVAGTGDPSPSLHLSWQGERTLDTIEVLPRPGPFARPTRVQILTPAGERTIDLDAGGRATFEALRSDSMTLTVVESEVERGGRRPFATPLAVAVAELRLPGLDDLRPRLDAGDDQIDLPCGAGPTITVDGHGVATRLSGTRSAVLDHEPLQFNACGVLQLDGIVDLDTESDHPFRVDQVRLAPTGGLELVASPRTVDVVRREDQRHRLRVGVGPASIIALTENANDGWEATMSGRRLPATVVDGWRQAFLVPSGDGGVVDVRFAPATTYRAALLGGAAAAVVVTLMAVGRRRRSTAIARAGAPRRWTAVAWATLIVAGIAGPAALLVPLLVAMPRRGTWAPPAAAASFIASAVVAASDAGRSPADAVGGFGATAQLLAVLAIATMLVSVVPDRTRGVRR